MGVRVKLMKFKSFTNFDSHFTVDKIYFVRLYLSEAISRFHVSVSFHCLSYINEHSVVLATSPITFFVMSK